MLNTYLTLLKLTYWQERFELMTTCVYLSTFTTQGYACKRQEGL